jgi:hypothetical protein
VIEPEGLMTIRSLLAGMFGCLAALPAAAQADRYPFQWMNADAQRNWGRGIAACVTDRDTLNGPCLMLTCRAGGPFEIAMMAYGGDFSRARPLPILVSVDGAPAVRLEMTQVPEPTDGEHAAVAYDAARHGALLSALRTGRTAQIGIYDPGTPPHAAFRFDLGARPDLVDAAMAGCGAQPPRAGAVPALPDPAATPVSAPERFVALDSSVADPEATAIARQLLARELAAEPDTSVTASLAVLPDGRRLLFAWHGPSTYSYGMTGHGTYVFASVPGGAFTRAYQTTGVEVWIDTQQLSEGFPDLWVLGWRGVDRPFGVWRHVGGAYAHQRNVPAR